MTSELLLTDIAQTFEEHEIILTGANGFLGKVVLGLLLDRFPNFKRLHVLLRPARNASAHERFRSETLASPALAAIVGFYPRRKGPGDASFRHTDEIRYCRERMREITESAGFGSRPRHGLPGRGSDAQEAGRSSDLARRLVALGRQRAERWGWVN